MRDLGNIRALNEGIEKTYGVSGATQRILAPIGDGQLLREALRRGLLVDGQVSDKGIDALHDVLVSHGVHPSTGAVAKSLTVNLDELDAVRVTEGPVETLDTLVARQAKEDFAAFQKAKQTGNIDKLFPASEGHGD